MTKAIAGKSHIGFALDDVEADIIGKSYKCLARKFAELVGCGELVNCINRVAACHQSPRAPGCSTIDWAFCHWCLIPIDAVRTSPHPTRANFPAVLVPEDVWREVQRYRPSALVWRSFTVGPNDYTGHRFDRT